MSRPGDSSRPVSPLWDGIGNAIRQEAHTYRLQHPTSGPRTRCVSCAVRCNGWSIPGYTGRYCHVCTTRITGSADTWYDPL